MDNNYELWLALNGKSKHTGHESEYRQTNPGLGIGFRQGNTQIGVGGYKNSNNKDSFYVDYLTNRKLFGPVSGGIGAGVVTGYQNQLQPYILPQISVGNKDQQVNLRYVPKHGETPETWMMNFEYKIK